MIISNESMDFNDPEEFDDTQLFDDPQLFHDQLEVWTLIIQKSAVIPSSPMVLLISYLDNLQLTPGVLAYPHLRI